MASAYMQVFTIASYLIVCESACMNQLIRESLYMNYCMEIHIRSLYVNKARDRSRQRFEEVDVR